MTENAVDVGGRRRIAALERPQLGANVEGNIGEPANRAATAFRTTTSDSFSPTKQQHPPVNTGPGQPVQASASSRLLVLSVSAGNGHVQAAKALVETANCWAPGWETTHVDAMNFVAPAFRAVYTTGYLQMVARTPRLWAAVHDRADRTPHTALPQRLRRAIERLCSAGLLREVNRQGPDAVICTHFLPAEVLRREQRLGRLPCPIWLQVTDYDMHNMWRVPDLAGYFAATDEVGFRMRACGLPAERIHITGIPVMPAFATRCGSEVSDPQTDTDRTARMAALADAGLALDAALPIVLVAAGGAGQSTLAAMVARLLGLGGAAARCQFVAVAGRHLATETALRALAATNPHRLIALGFTERMPALMRVADLVITKPGGLTVSECLALGKPMLLVSPVPGQEEHNADYLLERGAAWLAADETALAYKLARLLDEPDSLQVMAARSRALGRPGAAADVLSHVLASSRHLAACVA